MFDVKKEKLMIDNVEYDILPLTGEHLSDLYLVMGAFDKAKDSNEEILKALGTDASTKLHKLAVATLKVSYPDKDDVLLSQFVSQNLLKFLEPIVKVNISAE